MFVTPEYNHSTSPALLNALNYVYFEWNNKAAAFVSYGTSYGVRAVEHLRGVVGELQMADIRNQVRFALPGNFPDRVFTPGPEHDGQAIDLFDQLELWAGSPLSARSVDRGGLLQGGSMFDEAGFTLKGSVTEAAMRRVGPQK